MSHIFRYRTEFRGSMTAGSLAGIIFVIRNGLRWRDAPAEYGPPKTIYNRFIRWSRMGVFNKIFEALAAKGRQAGSADDRCHPSEGAQGGGQSAQKGAVPDVSDAPKAALTPNSMPSATARDGHSSCC
jgi:putative transposase